MKNRLLIPFAILAALGAIAVAGCGGDDETTADVTTGASGASGVTGAALTEDEFLEQGNAICAAGSKELDAQAQEVFGGQQPSPAELEQFVGDILVPSIQGQIDGVRALVPPDDIADDVTAFLDEAESALGEIEDEPSLAAASNAESPFAEANRMAEDLGLTECAG